MALAEIDVGPIPRDVVAAVIDYRIADSGDYVPLGETLDRVSRWDVPSDDAILIRARFRDSHGVGSGIEAPFGGALADRPAPSSLTAPEAAVRQSDGPVIEVRQSVPHGADPSEFIVEVAQTITSETAPRNGVHAGYAQPDDPVLLHSWPGNQKVWTRLVQLGDGRATAWASQTVVNIDPLVTPTLGHSDDFASGTIGLVGGMTTAEISGGDLRSVDMYAGDIDCYAGDCDLEAGDMGLRWPILYTTADVTPAELGPLVFQVQPDLASTTIPTLYAGDWLWPAGGPPPFGPDGTPFDARPLRDNLTAGGGDEMPLRMDLTAVVDGVEKTLLPGKPYTVGTTYAIRFRIGTHWNRRITIANLLVWHWIWCRSRWWHSHSDAGELVYENTLGSAQASVTATIAAQKFDELRVEVDWSNADGSASQFLVRFNNDSGSNYYKDGGAAATSMLVGSGTLAAGWYERVMFRMPRVKSGLERMVLVEPNARWSTTDSAAPAAASSVMWDNSADAITSVVFAATVGATPLAAGSRFRIWGRVHHEA